MFEVFSLEELCFLHNDLCFKSNIFVNDDGKIYVFGPSGHDLFYSESKQEHSFPTEWAIYPGHVIDCFCLRKA